MNRMYRKVSDGRVAYAVESYIGNKKNFTHIPLHSKEDAIEAANDEAFLNRGYQGELTIKVIELDDVDEYVATGGRSNGGKVVYAVNNNMEILSDSRRIKDSIDADFQNAIDIVKEVLDENQIDLTAEYESNSGTYTLEIARDNPSFVITSGYTSGSKKIDDKITDYFWELYDMAKDDYRADYPDIDEYESEGEEKAYNDALYALDNYYGVYYDIMLFKADFGVSVDLEVMGQKGNTTLWDTDTVLKNDYIDVNDVEGIRKQAQSVADFINNLHFD